MGRIGCLGVLLVLALLSLEVYVYLVVSHRIGDYLIPIIVMIVLGFVGFRLVRKSVAILPMTLLTGGSGRLLVRIIAGGLLIFPGLVTDALGLLLLIPGVSHLFSKLGDKILASVLKRSMGKMFAGQAGGFGAFGGMAGMGGFGGFPPPGGGGGPGIPGFPGFGGQPQTPKLTPDERAQFPRAPKPPKPPKTYDTTAEKE
jgi:UPF0716 family protein affecting phage T7 exclusion